MCGGNAKSANKMYVEKYSEQNQSSRSRNFINQFTKFNTFLLRIRRSFEF